MFTIDQIQEYYPPNQRDHKRHILREYLQSLILDSIFSSEFAFRLSFLGGTALRLIYGNNRFSEDLDFDNFGLEENEFIAVGNTVKNRLELEGYSVETNFVHRGAFRCNIRIPEILYINKISPLRDEKILIQLDSTPHGFDYEKQVRPLNLFGYQQPIYVTPKDIIFSQKIYAVFNRPRMLGRDFFDLSFLLGFSTIPNYDYLKLKLSISNSEELREKVLEKIAGLDFDALAEDVSPFVYDESQIIKVTRFPELWKSARL